MRPDFSGEWHLNRAASTLSPGADGVRSAVWNIDHREPTFHIKASAETIVEPIHWEYQMQTDAAEIVGDEPGASRLYWDGDALVVIMRIPRPDGEMTIEFRHQLLDDGRRLRADERLRGTDHDQDNVWMFDRRQG